MMNYKKCPLKKRPVFYEEPTAVAISPIKDEPQDLSIKRAAEEPCRNDAKRNRNFPLNLTVNSVYDNMKSGSKSFMYTRPESPVSISSETSHCSQVDSSISSSGTEFEYQNIHLRGISTAFQSYSNSAYSLPYNTLPAVWNNYSYISQVPQQTVTPPPTTVYNYHLTPPTSPGSCSTSSSEPEDLSVRNDIPLPALFHVFEEAPSTGRTAVSTRSYRFKCDSCSKMYSTSIGLSKHQQYHCPAAERNQEKKLHSCQECGKHYTTIGALKMHIRTHTLPCKCPICGKAFSRPWLLQGHIRTHTGEKPFSCSDCNRSFADRSNLRAHQQTHVEIKKYACKVCHKSFSRMSLLNKHANSNCTITIV